MAPMTGQCAGATESVRADTSETEAPGVAEAEPVAAPVAARTDSVAPTH